MPTTSKTVNGITYNTVTEGGILYACTGWIGTGNIPSTGTTNSTGSIIMTQTSSITWNWIMLPSALDIWVDKGGQGWNVSANAYGPQELVTMTAKLTSASNESVPLKTVTFNVYQNGTQIDSRTAITNTTGYAIATYRLPWPDTNPTSAFGIINITSAVTLTEVTLNDSCTFRYGYMLQTTSVEITNSNGNTSDGPHFSRNSGPTVNLSVTLTNFNWSTTSLDQTGFYLSGTIYDNNSVPVVCQILSSTISPVVSQTCNPSGSYSATFTMTLSIPQYAYVGQSTLYVNLFAGDPTRLAVPYCPEISIKLVIDG